MNLSIYSWIKLIAFSAVLLATALFSLLTVYKSFVLHSDIPKKIYSKAIIEDINLKRNNEGLPNLSHNSALAKAAQLKAEDMARNSYFSHNSPDGKTPWDFMEKAGYDFKFAGENLGVDFYDVNELDNAWMNSSGHRANILNYDFSETGIGVASGFYDGRQVLFYVQMFGHPGNNEEYANAKGRVLGTSTESFTAPDIENTHQFFVNPSLFLKYAYIALTLLLILASLVYALYSFQKTLIVRTLFYNASAIMFIWGLFYIYSMFSFTV